MTITVNHAVFRAAVGDVRTGADRLRTDRDRVNRHVDGLLGSGWTGAAAESFVSGWADWTAAAQDVLDGLEAMGHLLDAVHQDLVEQDAASQTRLDRLADRLVERLGR